MAKLNQKLTQSIVRRHSIHGVYTREKYLCKNLGLKEGGGHLPEGCAFSGTYCMCMCVRERRGGMREMAGVCGKCNCSHILGLH